jgi:hypothetical protein
MITSSDSFYTYDLGKYFAILPQTHTWLLQNFINHFNAVKVKQGFNYNSGQNTQWLEVEEIRTLIKKHVDPTFEV